MKGEERLAITDMTLKKFLKSIARSALLLILYFILFIVGTLPIAGLLPNVKSDPGLFSSDIGLFLIGITNTFIICGLILSSRWSGWKLTMGLSLAYYGAVTFLTQIETWYFLSGISVDARLLTWLLVMGLPIAFVYIPLAILILGKGHTQEQQTLENISDLPLKQWLWKLLIIAIGYVVLYWCAGYYVAWQNPELRAFYGSPGDITPFWEQTVNTLSTRPGLFPFQMLRGLLWALCCLPIIRGSKHKIGWTSLLLGIFLTVPQNVGLLLENPLMPSASVRMSHLIETFLSNFPFAMMIAWLLHRKHKSIQDLFGIKEQLS